MNGAPDPLIGGATADIPGHGSVDFIDAWMGIAAQQSGGLHDLAGLAIAALRHLLRDPRALNRMGTALGEPFNCGDPPAGGGRYRRLAGMHSLAVDVNRAGAAQPKAAPVLCSGQAERVPKNPQQRRFGKNVNFTQFVIHREPKMRHRM